MSDSAGDVARPRRAGGSGTPSWRIGKIRRGSRHRESLAPGTSRVVARTLQARRAARCRLNCEGGCMWEGTLGAVLVAVLAVVILFLAVLVFYRFTGGSSRGATRARHEGVRHEGIKL